MPIRSRAVVAVLLALWFAAGCSSEKPRDTRGKVLLIGLDGAEWSLLRPLIEAGEMPNLGRIYNAGVHGPLRSLEPLAKSPAIWTTIATGKSPAEHGIKGFVREKDGKLFTENARQVKAFWNILTDIDRSSGIVGWLMTWPAERINGFVVSDYLQYSAGPDLPIQNATYPPELMSVVQSGIVDPDALSMSYLQRFLGAPVDSTAIPPRLLAHMKPIRWTVAGDLTFARLAAALYKERRPDFFTVYLRGMDTLGHHFWNFHAPEAIPQVEVDPELHAYLGPTMRAYYTYVDDLLGPILDQADPTTTILVVSDHGFKGGLDRGIAMHNVDGVFMMSGYRAGKGEIQGASVYDVLPTLLVLMGLPPADDMPGKVLWSALDGSISQERFTKRLATYETGDRAGTSPVESPVDEEIKERLKSLGYID